MSAQPGSTELNHFARSLFSGLPSRYDMLALMLSLGQDRRWRRMLVQRIAGARPVLVLDVATGPAGIALEVARHSAARVVGVDLTEPMLRKAVDNIARYRLSGRVAVALARAEQLPFADATFDAVSFSYLLRYVDDPGATVAELARCLKPGGTMASLEFYVPPGRVWRGAWLGYTRAVLPAAGAVAGGRDWYRVGRFLGPSIRAHYRRWPLARHVGAWQAAGMRAVSTRVMSLGGGVVMWGMKAPGRA